MSQPSRRRVLRYGPVALFLGGIPGCLSRYDAAPTNSPSSPTPSRAGSPGRSTTTVSSSPSPSPSSTPLASPTERIAVRISNGTTASVTVHLTVTDGTDVVADASRELSPDGTVSIDSQIRETGTYTFTVAVDDGPSNSATFPVDPFDFRTGSNVVVRVLDDEVTVLIEE